MIATVFALSVAFALVVLAAAVAYPRRRKIKTIPGSLYRAMRTEGMDPHKVPLFRSRQRLSEQGW